MEPDVIDDYFDDTNENENKIENDVLNLFDDLILEVEKQQKNEKSFIHNFKNRSELTKQMNDILREEHKEIMDVRNKFIKEIDIRNVDRSERNKHENEILKLKYKYKKKLVDFCYDVIHATYPLKK